MDFEASRLGLAFAWRTPLGPVGGVLPGPSALAPSFVRHLSRRAHVTDDVAPRVGWMSDALGLAWVEDGIAFASVLDPQTGDARDGAIPLGPSFGVAIAEARGRPIVALADDEGVRLGWLGGELRRVVAHRGLHSHLELGATADDGVLLFFALRDDAVLGVAHLATRDVADPSVNARVVRHRVTGPIATFDALQIASQNGLALVYAGEHAARLETAIVEMTGAMRERPHRVRQLSSGTWAWARMVHVHDAFVIVAEERPAGVLHAIGTGSRALELRLDDVRGPFDAAFHRQRLVVGQACVAGDETQLRLRSCDARGERVQTHRVDATPADTRRRRQRAAARVLLERLCALQPGLGYREGRTGARVEEESAADGSGLARALLPGADGTDLVELGIRSEQEVEVRLASIEPDAALPPAELLWQARFARWVRRQVSAAARAAADADRAWCAELMGSATELEVVRAAGSVAVRARLAALPTVERILEQLADLRASRRRKDERR